jgi:hypothetical protein
LGPIVPIKVCVKKARKHPLAELSTDHFKKLKY